MTAHAAPEDGAAIDAVRIEEAGLDNAPAIAVYRRMGFATLYSYHYRARPGECR